MWQQGGHPQNEGGPYRKRAAARAALRKRGGPKGGPAGRQAGPGGPSGRPSGQVAARRAARARPKGGQNRARGRPTGPPSRPDHSVKCAGSSKSGSGDLFVPIFFGVCVKDALFLPPRGPLPPPQAHQRPRPVKATTYRTPVRARPVRVRALNVSRPPPCETRAQGCAPSGRNSRVHTPHATSHQHRLLCAPARPHCRR